MIIATVPPRKTIRKQCDSCGQFKTLAAYDRYGLSIYDNRTKCDACVDADKARHQERNFKHRYGLTLAERDELLAAQDGRCAICGTSEFGLKGPVVDHCHNSSEVRGILCNHCNVGLGQFKDDVELMEKAIEYLKAHVEDFFGGDAA